MMAFQIHGSININKEEMPVSLYEKGSELVQKGRDIIMSGRDMAIRKSEKVLKTERMKMEIKEIKEQKEDKLRELARKVYEQYTKNKLTDPELIELCQDVKTLQWQIDEKWTAINNLKAQKETH